MAVASFFWDEVYFSIDNLIFTCRIEGISALFNNYVKDFLGGYF